MSRVALALLLTLAASASAQDDAKSLLREVAVAAHAVKTLRLEGTQRWELNVQGRIMQDEINFKLLSGGPDKLRWEVSGADQSLVICDGTNHWTYDIPNGSFSVASANASPCALPVSAGDKIADKLVAASITGHQSLPVNGASRECEILRVEYEKPLPPHTVCIDPVHKMLLSDRSERPGGPNGHFTATVTLTVAERDAKLPRDAFDFQVPTGTFQETASEQDNPQAAEAAAFARPALIEKVEPSYTDEARNAGVAGLVLVSLSVNAEGKPENVKIARGLGHGLDEKAIEAVGRWRFKPIANKGAPTATLPLVVAVNFHL